MSIISRLQPRGVERAAFWWLLCGVILNLELKHLFWLDNRDAVKHILPEQEIVLELLNAALFLKKKK